MQKMKHMKNWNSTEIVKKCDLQENYWHQGFFHLDFGKTEFYRRDFDELKWRDLSLFSLNQIESKKILDVGCGSGLYTLTFLKLGADFVAGQDISEEAVNSTIDTCKKNGFSNFSIKKGNCETLLFDDNSFDLAFSGDVFEHITKEQKINFINEIYRVLKPGGLLTIKTPNKSYLKMSTFLRQIIALMKIKNPFKIHIPHTHNNPNNEHHGLTTISELKKILNATMFHSPEITYKELNKKHIPLLIKKTFRKSSVFNQHIIITVRKPIFYGIYL